MLSIKDIVELAKSGYKPADVKELIELSTETVKDETETVKDETETSKDETETVKDETEEPDYKELYEATKIELDKAQKENIKRDRSSENDDKSDEDIIKELFKDFM